MNHDSLCFALAPCQTNDGDARITASIVPAEQRMDFLPKHFGARAMMKFEMSVYDWMGNLCPSYRGGYWNYVELSNGGAFMYPAGVDAFEFTVEGNGIVESGGGGGGGGVVDTSAGGGGCAMVAGLTPMITEWLAGGYRNYDTNETNANRNAALWNAKLLQPIPVELDPGAAVFFDGRVVHGSRVNTSSVPRRAISFSYIY